MGPLHSDPWSTGPSTGQVAAGQEPPVQGVNEFGDPLTVAGEGVGSPAPLRWLCVTAVDRAGQGSGRG